MTNAWSRDGVAIADGGPFDISLSVNESSIRRFSDSVYVSVLTVTGRYPGMYEYSVSNRDNANAVTDRFTVEGK